MRLHRVVVRMRPSGPAPRQRERVDHRPAPGVAMKVVEPAQDTFAMRPCGRRVVTPGRGLSRHPVGYPGIRAAGSPRQASRPVGISPAARTGRLDSDLDPAAEIAGLDPGRLIPRHPDRPQEPEPPKDSHNNYFGSSGRVAGSADVARIV